MFDLYVLPFALVVSAAVLIAAAVRRALAARLAELDAASARHPAKGDHVRLEQMLAIAEAEDAWDRDVWGGR